MSGTFGLNIHKTEPGKVQVKLSGPITEKAQFIPGSIPPTVNLEIDLGGITSINSSGVRALKEWLYSLQNPAMVLVCCPSFVVNQINMIPDLLPTSAKVKSFYVPFYSPALSEEKMALFTDGVEVREQGGGLILKIPEVKDSVGQPMEMDVVSERFFVFMRRQKGLP